MTLICMKIKLNAELIFIWMVSHLDSFWNRGTRELGNGLLVGHYTGIAEVVGLNPFQAWTFFFRALILQLLKVHLTPQYF